jgi:hypothetical protein
MIKQAINELYEKFPYEIKLKYSGKFKPYNANIKMRYDKIQVNLSKKWKTVSKEIQIGLVQELLLKILKNKLKPLKTKTDSMQLYNTFIKKLHLGAPITQTDSILEESFNRVNEKYFYNFMDETNLVWGSPSLSKLGSYEYATDTISISSIFKTVDKKFLDYIMYHEMLHKKHKFYTKNGRNYHHTGDFKKKEKEFEDSELMEKEIQKLVRRNRSLFKKIFYM